MDKTKLFLNYLLRKLAAAGLTLVSFMLFIYLFSYLRIYYTFQTMELLNIWFVLYVYGLLSSIIIDVLVHLFPKYRKRITVFLYAIAGYLYVIIFLNIPALVGIVLVGGIGAIFALIFLYSEGLLFAKKRLQLVFGLLIPILLFIAITLTRM